MQLHFVFGVTLLKFLNFWLKLLHFRHRLITLVRQWEENEFDDQGKDENSDAEIAKIIAEEIKRIENRARQEEKMPPIDSFVEIMNAKPAFFRQRFIGLKQINIFGPAKHIGIVGR